MSSPISLFACSGFSLNVDGKDLFQAIDVDIPRNCIVRVSGANGVGKSTLLRFISGSGIAYKGRVLHRPAVDSVLLLSQLHGLQTQLPYTLAEVAEFVQGRQPAQSLSPEELGDRYEIPSRWFSVELSSKVWNLASGGERMKALLAGAFASDAPVLLLDEPFNHLDDASADLVRRAMLARVSTEVQKTIFFVSHDGTEDFLNEGGCVLKIELRATEQRSK